VRSDQLLALFQRGFIPGPHESEEAFLMRVQSRPSLSLPEWQEIASSLQREWGFSIDWVPITYSAKKLLPWEGALFWIQEDGNPLIQLRRSLQSKKMWGNSRPEILLHEAIHAARETFNEPRFEEFLAYTTSHTSWKRWLGPLFQRPWEFPLFALAVFGIALFPLASCLILAFFIGRSFYNHYLFYSLKKKIPLPILLCLTDSEIRRGNPFQEKVNSETAGTLRLQLIEVLRKEFPF